MKFYKGLVVIDKHGFDIGGNLRKLMTEHNINASQLGMVLNLSAATIKKIRKGGNPTIGSLQPIADYFKITISQLIGNVAPEQKDKPNRQTRKSSMQVPIIKWSDITSGSNLPIPCSLVNVRYKLGSKVYALIVPDKSYEMFQEGGLLFVDPEEPYGNQDYVLVQKQHQNPNIKKMIEEDGFYHLQSITPGISTTLPLNDEFRILGVIVGYNKWFREEC